MPDTAQAAPSQAGDAPDDAGSTVSERQFEELEDYAEKSRQDDESAELLERTPPLVQRGGIYLIGAAVVLTLGLLYFGKVNEMVTAEGRLVPDGQSVSVQALESGVVTDVLAQPGDRLEKGTPLLRLEEERSGQSLAALQRQLRLQRRHLRALRADSALMARATTGPEQFLRAGGAQAATAEVLQLVNDLRLAWMDRRNASARSTDQFPQQREQARRETELAKERINVLKKNRQAARAELKQARETLKETRGLQERGYVSEAALRREESKVRRKEQRVAQLGLDLSNQRIRLNDLKMKLDKQARTTRKQRASAQMSYQQSLERLRQGERDLHGRLRKQAAKVQRTREKIAGQRRQMAQTTVTTPVAGTAAEVNVSSPGELVNTGKVVAVVVPTGEPLVARVKVPNKDIGAVKEGQDVNLKVQAFPHQQFGTAPGRVANVFPNAGESQHFTVEVRLLEDSLSTGGETASLFPGLTVTADIVAGKQRLLNLLLSQKSGQKKGGGK